MQVLNSFASDKLSIPQQEVCDSGLLSSGFHTILQMPTGSGKTWLAEQAIANILSGDRRVIYVVPLRALADELRSRWQKRFEAKKVGLFTGDYNQGEYPVSFKDAQLLIMTPEKLDACTRNWRSHWHWLPDVDLVVVDELHLLGDPHRGHRLEGVLMRLIRLNPFLRIFGLSATLGNRHQLADWLGGVEYYSNWRPVPLSWKVVRYKKAQQKPELLLREIKRNLSDGGKSLVFVQSRRRAEALAKFLQEAGLKASHHHAGLNREKRQKIEEEFRNNHLDVLIATATLEMGLNLPARQVILYDLQFFDGEDFVSLPVNNVWQRAGRAGRLGFDKTGEVVLIAPKWDGKADEYAKGKFEPIRSSLIRPQAIAEQILAEVASGLCNYAEQLERLFATSLAAKQYPSLSVKQVLKDMLEAEMLQEIEVEGSLKLRANRLGWVAVRHLLMPKTVLLFQRVLNSYSQLTFLDILILVASSDDFSPLLPVDYESLEELEERLQHESTFFLECSHETIQKILGIGGKRLLSVIHTALTIRNFTRLGDAELTAQQSGCYEFEVYQLQESFCRLLQALLQVVIILDKGKESINEIGLVPLQERIYTLSRMIEGGLNEESVTLTIIPGIGTKLAHRLKSFNIKDLEDLGLAEVSDLSSIPGISDKRAQKWIEQADDIIQGNYSAYRYREEPTAHCIKLTNFPADIDPYRLRRALSLTVSSLNHFSYKVTGGLDPHLVTNRNKKMECDCIDWQKGNVCKHIFAVKIKQGDKTLKDLSNQLLATDSLQELNLLKLWMGTC
ncbi:MAG: DEAD/DEAH box helicase [Snowella sp.]|nr:DEAD/DEAH box helicase [Snowella sp.]